MATGGKGEEVVRFSLGRETKTEDIMRVANEVIHLVPLLRAMQTNSN